MPKRSRNIKCLQMLFRENNGAAYIAKKLNLKRQSVYMWVARGSIPPQYAKKLADMSMVFSEQDFLTE